MLQSSFSARRAQHTRRFLHFLQYASGVSFQRQLSYSQLTQTVQVPLDSPGFTLIDGLRAFAVVRLRGFTADFVPALLPTQHYMQRKLVSL